RGGAQARRADPGRGQRRRPRSLLHGVLQPAAGTVERVVAADAGEDRCAALGLPWGIWLTGFLPYLPLPSKFVYRVGTPIELGHDPDAARDRRGPGTTSWGDYARATGLVH